MLARFSTVAGELGAADAERDVRGFALKFYTEEGNWDLVGNNTPVFFVRDPLQVPRLHPHPEAPSADQPALADRDVGFLVAVAGEPAPGDDPDVGPRPAAAPTLHATATARTPISFINAAGERFWVKFHFKTLQGHKHYTNARGRGRSSARPARATRSDLFGAIERRRLPAVDDAGAGHAGGRRRTRHCYNPFDLTKVWPHADYPLIEVGVLELNRNPDNYFAEIEQAAFSPSNIVPGIGFSPDKMLQARIFSYADAHRYRLGTHYEALPVNAPKCPVHHYHKDGPMRFFPQRHRQRRTPTTSRTRSAAPAEDKRFAEPPLTISGDADRYNHRDGNDDYRQAGDLFRLMPATRRRA